MISASSNKPALEIDRTYFKDELERSVLLDINCQTDDTPESRRADVYSTQLEQLNKSLKSNGCQAPYTASMIGQRLSELKQIYRGNKKLLIYATKHLVTISYVYFYDDVCDLVTIYYRVSRISLPLRTVRSKFKLIKEIVHEDEAF